MLQDIDVVTAFFKLDRSNWSGFQRSEEKYFEYFCEWAKLKNNLVVYVESEVLKEKVHAFRKSLNLLEKDSSDCD